MKCLRKYQWVKLPRAGLPNGKGLLGSWARLAAAAAFRKGSAVYCGHKNDVEPGEWAGGMVGIKAILNLKNRKKAEQILYELENLGYLKVTYDSHTKKLSYRVTDWVTKCSGKETSSGIVYATEEYGFIGVPRGLTDRITEKGRTFEESDAWMDLWCHTVYEDYGNAFSFLAPAVQFGKYGSVLSLEALGHRWGWEKTKVWRFFRKYAEVFSLHRLPGSYGCLIFNLSFPNGEGKTDPEEADIDRILNEIRLTGNARSQGHTGNDGLNQLVAWNSRAVMIKWNEEKESPKHTNRVALLSSYIRAYFSHGRNRKICKRDQYDCQGWITAHFRKISNSNKIRGPCYGHRNPPKIT